MPAAFISFVTDFGGRAPATTRVRLGLSHDTPHVIEVA